MGFGVAAVKSEFSAPSRSTRKYRGTFCFLVRPLKSLDDSRLTAIIGSFVVMCSYVLQAGARVIPLSFCCHPRASAKGSLSLAGSSFSISPSNGKQPSAIRKFLHQLLRAAAITRRYFFSLNLSTFRCFRIQLRHGCYLSLTIAQGVDFQFVFVFGFQAQLSSAERVLLRIAV